jgi:hypothetical protein
VGETLVTVEELIEQSGGAVDVTWIYEAWRDKLAGLLKIVQDKFELTPDPSTDGLEIEGHLGSGAHGAVTCFAGPKIDWLVYSWMADPKNGFANLHLTISPGPETDMPLFGLAFACFGVRPWAYVDFGAPRANLDMDLDYFQKYYGGLNDHWLETRRANPQMDWFTSPSAYIRSVTSPIAFCYSGPQEQRTVDLILSETEFYLRHWLDLFDKADPVPAEKQPEVLKYTEDWRHTIAEQDPANSLAVTLFGQDTTDILVKRLWGEGRVLPHAGADWK